MGLRHFVASALTSTVVIGMMASGCATEPESQEAFTRESCPGGTVHLVDGKPAAWTVIHFAAADNNLERVIMGDIDEMERGHRGSDAVNVIVQLDKESEPGSWRYRVTPNNEEGIQSELVQYGEEELDSGDWKTLAEFGEWAVGCYPADHYMVVIGGHGSGWSSSDQDPDARLSDRSRHERFAQFAEPYRKIAPDSTDHSEMKVNELVKALDRVRRATVRPDDPDYLNRLAIYGSDACLMQTVEVAYDLRNEVNYVIGSEQNEPGDGWPYNTVIRELTERPHYYAQRPHRLAETIVDNYEASYGQSGSATNSTKITLAAVDTAHIIKLKHRVDTIAGLLLELLDQEPRLIDFIASARGQSFTFGDDYTDLGKLLTVLRAGLVDADLMPEKGETWQGDERWRDLRNAIDEIVEEIWPELVLANIAGRHDGAMGISIFFSVDECGRGITPEEYKSAPFAKDTRWGELVAKMIEIGEAGSLQETRGSGSMTVMLDGEAHEGRAKCEISDGKLSVYFKPSSYCQPSECGPISDLAFDIDPVNQKLDKAYFLSNELDVEQEQNDLGMSFEAIESWDQGEAYAAKFSVDFARDEGEPVHVEVDFKCDYFSAHSCWGNFW